MHQRLKQYLESMFMLERHVNNNTNIIGHYEGRVKERFENNFNERIVLVEKKFVILVSDEFINDFIW